MCRETIADNFICDLLASVIRWIVSGTCIGLSVQQADMDDDRHVVPNLFVWVARDFIGPPCPPSKLTSRRELCKEQVPKARSIVRSWHHFAEILRNTASLLEHHVGEVLEELVVRVALLRGEEARISES